jgi:hypothetical protein
MAVSARSLEVPGTLGRDYHETLTGERAGQRLDQGRVQIARIDLPVQEQDRKIPGDRLIPPDDLRMAPAKPAQAVAERDMDVEAPRVPQGPA